MMNTHGLIIDFGKHRGMPWTRVPVGYLFWCVNSLPENHSGRAIAQAELDRRGSKLPTLDLSGHAIDRISQHSLDLWSADRRGEEGLHSWIVRIAEEALQARPDSKGRHRHPRLHLAFCFEPGNEFPYLKTVIRTDGGDDE